MKQCPLCTTEYPESQRTCPRDGVVLVERREMAQGSVFRDTYRIERVLGRGGMGVVYLAEHLLLGQLRALKFLSSELASNPAAVQRFLREAKRAAEIGLHHPNIVKTLDLGQGEDGGFFICMEYVDGTSLDRLLERYPLGLPVEQVLGIVRGIAAGLEAAHARRMVHRDIKPGNILLARQADGGETPKIADFGIVTGSDAEVHLTRTGTGRQPLTPDYAAPEQWKGLIPGRDLDGRTDLYALGCMFFEMLTGATPYQGANAAELMKQHLSAPVPVASRMRPELARWIGLDAAVQRLMAKERENRPADVRAFLAELDRVALEETARSPQAGPAFDVRQATVLERFGPSPTSTPLKTSSQTNSAAAKPTGTDYSAPYSAPYSSTRVEGFRADQRVAAPGMPPVEASVEARAQVQTGLKPTPPVMDVAPRTNGKRRLLLRVLGGALVLAVGVVAGVLLFGKGDLPWMESKAARGIALFKQHKYQEAMPLLERGCDNDSMESCKILGTLLTDTPGVKSDYGRAHGLLEKACNGNYLDGCAGLARLYVYHWGVEQDYARAFSLFERACEGNSMLGCNGLGYLYIAGLGVTKDPARALGLFEKACDNGYAKACSNLASNYENGTDVKQDYGRAIALNEKACDGDDMIGCLNLGDMYQSGRGVGQDSARAAGLYQKACDENLYAACTSAGWMYENKRGVEQDYTRAMTLYQKACDGNNAEGCYYQGNLYENKRGVEQDYGQALALFQKGCDSSSANACTALGYMYAKPLGVKQDETRALELYTKGCDGGSSVGCYDEATVYTNGEGVAKDPRRAAPLYQKACDSGDFDSCDKLGSMYYNGNGVPHDDAKAAPLFKRGCDGGNMADCTTLGAMYFYGKGVAVNRPLAVSLTVKACDHNNPDGCSNLGNLYRLGEGVPKDLVKARALLTKGCSMGSSFGCARLKEM